jgi:hypothetical protein
VHDQRPNLTFGKTTDASMFFTLALHAPPKCTESLGKAFR